MSRTRICHLLPALLLPLLVVPVYATEEGSWIQKSNEHASFVLEGTGRLYPEFASSQGLEGADTDVTVLDKDLVAESFALLKAQLAELEERLTNTEDPRVAQDLEILIASRREALAQAEAEEALLMPYYNVAEAVFRGLSGLLDPQVEEARRPAALIRLRRYAGIEDGYRPMTELARERTGERMGDASLVWPYRGEIEQDLENAPRYLAGIAQLFQMSGLQDYEEDLEVLKGQVDAYAEWTREVVLPRARADFRQPGQLYQLALEQWGVDATPDELIADGLAGFMEIRGQMQALAPQVAASRGWELTDYRDVIAELKKEQFQGEAIVERYRQINDALEEIIVREQIISLPERPAVIRVATDAEAAAVPQPHLKTPRLVNNEGELVEFLIPVTDPAAGKGHSAHANDTTYEAMAWTLAAHELRPGHELQFSAMMDRGVSAVRALYAFNSTNVEGWALYAEAEVKPYLPLDGQLLGLQMRLLRAARSFLDPMLNTGRISADEARKILVEQVAMTPATAQLELDRYMFRIPGQAPAYYYGYRRLLEIRARAELALSERFDRRSFHDFILDQGLLPPVLLERAVMEEYVPSRAAVAGG